MIWLIATKPHKSKDSCYTIWREQFKHAIKRLSVLPES